MRSACVWILAAAVTLAGCGDSTGPGQVQGTYHLERVDGQPLPAVVWEETWGGDVWIDLLTSGRLTLVENVATLRLAGEERYNGTVEYTWDEQVTGSYTLEGSETVVFRFDDYGDVVLFAGRHDGNRLYLYFWMAVLEFRK